MGTLNKAKGRLLHWTAFAALGLAIALVLTGCERKKKYSQATPDDVISTAVEMIKDGQTAQLGNLIYADSPEMRAMLNKLGVLMGHMQSLSRAAEQRFPEEMAAIKDKAVQAAADGQTTSLLNQMMSGASGRAGSRGVSISNRGVERKGAGSTAVGGAVDEGQVEELFNRLFADPYGWIERNSARLSTLKTADDSATVLLDGEPIIPGLGLPMRKDDGKWYISLPTNMPVVSNFWPRTKDQWRILNSVVTVLDRTVVDMEKDVQQGQTATLSSLGTEARKKVIIPGAIAFAAYGKEIDVRGRIDRRIKQLQTKQREWSATKREAGFEMPTKLFAAMNKLAAEEIEPLVRRNKAPNIEKMNNTEFEQMINGWFTNAGLAVKVDGQLEPVDMDRQITEWEEARKLASTKKR